jgi:type VI secretion system protein ImpA
MSELIEKLLAPVSPDKPCGQDLSYDPRFEALETILKGKPEVEIGSVNKPAEPPDWGDLKNKSAEFLGQSKHLRVAAMTTCSLLKTGGMAGFLDGLQLMRGLLEQYWPTVYPLLDPDDNNDPTQRLNILGALTAARGSVDSWLKIVDYLYTTPISRPKGGAPITFDDIQAAKLKASGAEGAPANAPDLASLRGAILNGGAAQVEAHHKLLEQSLEATQGIDQFLTTTLGAGNTISFEGLKNVLIEMIEGVKGFLPGGAAEAGIGADAGSVSEGGSAAVGGGIPVSGSIRSSEHVVRALDSICEYYRQVEPSSPVPYLLRRAQKLAKMDFVQAVQELNLTTVDGLRPSMGSAVDGGAPPPA